MAGRLDEVMADWGLTAPEPLAETGIARLFTVSDGKTRRVLKLYHGGGMGNEAGGLALLRHWQGSPSAVTVRRACQDAVLMDLLKGPSPGDMARAGQDMTACATLAGVAARLHRVAGLPSGLTPLEVWCAPLLAIEFGPDCPKGLRRDMERAAALCRALLGSAPSPVALHGDLHHDNVILTRDGPMSFDPKGLMGDPAFELANALRNPKGCRALQRDPERILRCLELYARVLSVPLPRMAGWAAAKCGLSIAWRAKGVLSGDAEADLLASLLEAAKRVRAAQ